MSPSPLPSPPASVEPAILLRGLGKTYTGGVRAVQGVDLEIMPGEIFGIIGPDGAGKTTTFQILSGIMEASSGEVRVLGRSAREARRKVGYLTQVFSLYLDLSVEENLRYMGEMRGLEPAKIEERGMRYLQLFDMHRFTGRLAGRLSGGMKQKLALACALIAEPELLLLDEPTTGVDPVSRREFWDTLSDLSASGMTIVVATPYLDEAERCKRVALMYEGRIQQTGTPAELRNSLGLSRLEVRAANLSAAEEVLGPDVAEERLADVQRFGDRLDILARDAGEGEQLVRKRLKSAGLTLSELRPASPTLENVFVSLLRDLGTGVDESLARAVPFTRETTGSEMTAIGASKLTRRFGDFTAVKDVSLEIRPGEIYGLLGANGAGKTTTIKMLCGLLEPSSGDTILAGASGAATRSPRVRQRVGYMSQKFSLYDDLTIDQNLEFYASVYGVPSSELASKKRWVLEFAGLSGRGKMLTGELPGGWKQRVAFGAAILHEPEVLFLDEPTSGVDPIARRAFWQVINQLADCGVAILVTTHYLEEAEQCNRLGFMVAGEVVTEGTPGGVKEALGGHLLVLETDDPQRATQLLKRSLDRWRVSQFASLVHAIVDDSIASSLEQAIERLRKTLAAAGIALHQAREDRYSLEDVFIVVVEKARLAGKSATED